jgi:hypothetical protein
MINNHDLLYSLIIHYNSLSFTIIAYHYQSSSNAIRCIKTRHYSFEDVAKPTIIETPVRSIFMISADIDVRRLRRKMTPLV